MGAHEKTYALGPNISFREVGESGILLNTVSGQIYTCNDTARAFVKGIDGQRKFAELIDLVLEEFEVGRDQLNADLADFIGKLEEESVVVPVGGAA